MGTPCERNTFTEARDLQTVLEYPLGLFANPLFKKHHRLQQKRPLRLHGGCCGDTKKIGHIKEVGDFQIDKELPIFKSCKS